MSIPFEKVETDAESRELLALYDREAKALGADPRAAFLLYEMGRIHQERLRDARQAVSCYQAAFHLAPYLVPNLQALRRLSAEIGDFEVVVETIDAELALTTHPAERGALLLEKGVALEEGLHRPDQALAAFDASLQANPGEVRLLIALEQRFASRGDHSRLADLLARLGDATSDEALKVSSLCAAASLSHDRLGIPEVAASLYRKALAIAPGDPAALGGLARLLESEKRFEELVQLHRHESDRAPSTDQAAALLFQAGGILEGKLARLDEAIASYQEVLTLSPNHFPALRALVRIYRSQQAWESLVETLRAEAAARSDPREQVSALFEVALLCEEKLNRPEEAIEAYEDLLKLSPAYAPAVRSLERMYMESGRWENLASLYERQTDVLSIAKLAWLCEERLSDPARAIQIWETLLASDSENLEALKSLERLRAQEPGRRAEMRTRIAARLGDLRAAAAFRLSGLEDRSGRLELSPPGELEAVLAWDPEEPRALAALELAYRRSGDPRALAALLERRARAATTAEQWMGLWMQVAELCAGELGDATRALTAYSAVLEADPRHLPALRGARRIHTSVGNWNDARRLALAEADSYLDSKLAADAYFEAGLISQDQLADVVAARDAYTRASEKNPDDPRPAQRLEQLSAPITAAPITAAPVAPAMESPDAWMQVAQDYERTGRLVELIQLLEQQTQAAKDPAQVAAMRMKLGELYDKQGDSTRAIGSYRRAIEASPRALPPRVELAEILAREPGGSVQAAEEHRAILKLDPLRVDSYRSLYQLFEGSRQTDRAFCAASLLAYFKAANEVEIAFFAEARGRVAAETTERLPDVDHDTLLLHPSARSPLTEVLRLIGGHLHDRFEELRAKLDQQGIHPKTDRLKPDHPLHKLTRGIASTMGVEELEVYQGKRGAGVTLELTDPLSLVVGPDFVRRYQVREQRFLIARACLGLRNRLAVVHKLDAGANALADLLGNALRAVNPGFARLGSPNDDMIKRLKKALPGKALKALEAPAAELERSKPADLCSWLAGLAASGDRAGMLYCADIPAALSLLMRENPAFSMIRLDATQQIAAALQGRPDMLEMLGFVVSEDFLRLRLKMRLCLG